MVRVEVHENHRFRRMKHGSSPSSSRSYIAT